MSLPAYETECSGDGNRRHSSHVKKSRAIHSSHGSHEIYPPSTTEGHVAHRRELTVSRQTKSVNSSSFSLSLSLTLSLSLSLCLSLPIDEVISSEIFRIDYCKNIPAVPLVIFLHTHVVNHTLSPPVSNMLFSLSPSLAAAARLFQQTQPSSYSAHTVTVHPEDPHAHPVG